MDKKLCETTNLCVEIMNSKPRKVMGELGQVVQIRVCRWRQRTNGKSEFGPRDQVL